MRVVPCNKGIKSFDVKLRCFEVGNEWKVEK